MWQFRKKNTIDSLAADRRGGHFDRTGNFKIKRISNNEYRMSKEGICLFYKKRLSQTKRPFEILRFDILLFCGSLFRPGEISNK
jgi:hypothetical protein